MLIFYLTYFVFVNVQTKSIDDNIIPTTCTHTVSTSCGLSECTTLKEKECFHGTCEVQTGNCDCSHCWSGESCDILENMNTPLFLQERIEIEYDGNPRKIASLEAFDLDAEKCNISLGQCHCSTVLYAIEAGNDDSMFMIDPTTGIISYSQESPDAFNGRRKLIVSAQNPVHRNRRSIEMSSLSLVELVVDFEQVHSRKKRTNPSSMPGTPTFLLEKLDSFTGITELYVGNRVTMQLSIWLPAQTYDIGIELYTPSESSAIMTICNPVISYVGTNYDQQIETSVFTLEAKANDKRWDHALLELGSVANDGTDAADADASKIVVNFSVVLVENNATQSDTSYSVTTGVAYDNEVWIGQVFFTAVLDHDTWQSPHPSLTVSSPSEIYEGTAAIVDVSMIIREYASIIRLDVMTPFSEQPIMNVCTMGVGTYGSSYGCLSKDLPNFYSPQQNDTSRYNVTASLDFGSITNAEKRSRPGDNDVSDTIDVQVVMYLTNSTDIVFGQNYLIGISLTVDDEHIYSNQIVVTALESQGATLTQEAVIEFFAADGNDVVIGGLVGFVVTITIPEAATSTYTVDLSMPLVNGQAELVICTASVYFVGYNMPCLGPVIPSFTRTDNVNADHVKLNLGKVTNVGRRSLSDDNTIKIRVTAKLLPTAVNNTSHLVSAGVRHDLSDREVLWVAQLPVKAVDDMPHDYTNDITKQPTIELWNPAKDSFIYNQGVSAFTIDLIIPSGTTFSPFSLSIDVPEYEEEPLFTICEVNIKVIGDSFPCYGVKDFQIVYNTTRGTNMATVTSDPFTNHLFEKPLNDDDNKLTFEVTFKSNEHPSINDGELYNISVNFNYGRNTLQKTIEYTVSFSDPELSDEDEAPQFSLELDTGHTSVLVSEEATAFIIKVYTPINSATTYLLDIASQNNTLSICRAKLIERGSNLPCLDIDKKASYHSYENDGKNDHAVLDLGVVRNTGMTHTDMFRDNYMIAQVVLKLEEEALIEADSHVFDVTMRLGSTNIWSASSNVTVNTTHTTGQLVTPAVIKFNKGNSLTSVTIGSAAVFNLDIYIPLKSIAHYEIEFSSPSVKIIICEARVISSGWNIPCVNGSTILTIFNASTGITYLDAGFIANMETQGTNQTSINNRVRVQVIVKVQENATESADSPGLLDASVHVNSQEVFDSQMPFEISETLNPDETNTNAIFRVFGPTENITTSSIDQLDIFIGQKQVYTVNITTESIITNMTIGIHMPVLPDQAYLTITNISLVKAGQNFACYSDKLNLLYTSSFDSSQMDSAVVDLGLITNLGTSHYYQFEEYAQEDDDIIIEIEVQLADNDLLDTQDILEFNVTLEYGNDRTAITTRYVTVIITENEKPELEFEMNVPDYDPNDLNQGDKLLVDVTIQHTDVSSAHAYDVIVNLMIPYYIEIDDSVDVNSGQSMCSRKTDDGHQFTFEEMYFTDIVTLYFNFSIDPNRVIPMGIGLVNTTIPMEIIYYKRSGYDDSGNVILGQVYKTETVVVNLPFTAAECADILGMRSAVILDCQISASSSLNETHTHIEARPDANGWSAGNRYYDKEYIQVQFGGLHRFGSVESQGDNDNASVMSFTISFTEEFVIWHDYMEQSQIKDFVNDFNTSYAMPSINHTLANPFDAIAIRIHPNYHTSTSTSRLLRFELYGCQKAESLNPSVACPNDEKAELGQYDRGVLVDPVTERIFVCVLQDIEQPKRCSYSDDVGVSWEDIDDNIGNIVAIVNATSEIYGIAQNDQVLMRSDDLGSNWYTVTQDNYEEYQQNNELMTKVAVIPNDMFPGDDVMLNFSTATGTELKASHDGLYYNAGGNWQMIGRWTAT